ncbi:MFS transporter [Metabacillus fastidiosus]|uniref:MFS transporter n=1 Tax=Metabacillus fastidiosus TaxID=1458 RepID=UPI003D2C6030
MDEVKQPIWSKSFFSIFVSNFFMFLIFYALLTSLPIYVIDDLHRTKTEAGLIVTIFLLSAIIIRPFSGKLLEKFGKKRMLIISLIFFTISTFLYLVIEPFSLLLGLRFFHGIWFSIATTATGAMAADVIPAKRRGEGLGYYAMSTNIAIVCGPFIALTLLQFIEFSLLFLILSLLMVVGLGLTFTVKTPEIESPLPQKAKLSLEDLFEKRAIPIALIGCLVSFVYSSILSFISIYAKELGLLEAASYFFLTFAAAMVISRPFTGRLFDIKGANYVIYPAFFLFAIGLICLSATHSSFMLLLSGALIGLGYGSLAPSLQTLAVQSADVKRSGHATATYFTLYDTGIAIGSYTLGIIASLFGYSHLYFYVGLFLICIFLLYRWMQAQRKDLKLYPKESS